MNEDTIKAELTSRIEAIEARSRKNELTDKEAGQLMQMERKIADRKMMDLAKARRRQIEHQIV